MNSTPSAFFAIGEPIQWAELGAQHRLTVFLDQHVFWLSIHEKEKGITSIEAYNSSWDSHHTIFENLLSNHRNSTILKDCTIVEYHNVYTLVPRVFYQKKDNKKYLQANFNEDFSGVKINHSRLNKIDAQMVFQQKTKLNYPIQHGLGLMIQSLMENYWGQKPMMIAHWTDSQLDILFVQDKKLNFINSFPCKDINDFKYFVLAGYKTQEIPADYCPLIITGNAIDIEEIRLSMQNYILEIGAPNNIPSLAFNFKIPPHFLSQYFIPLIATISHENN